MKFFEAESGYHVLSEKFWESKPERIIDIMYSYRSIHCHAASSVFKASAIKNLRFDTRLKYGEDALFLNLVNLKKRKYGILTNALYMYRKRADESSAIQSQNTSLSWHFDSPKYYYTVLAEKSIEMYGEVLPYVQYVLYNDMHYRLNKPLGDFLSEEQKDAYVESLAEIFRKYISDFIIMCHKRAGIENKLLALRLKYGHVKRHLTFVDHNIYFNNFSVASFLEAEWAYEVTNLEIRKNVLYLEANVRKCLVDLMDEYQIFFRSVGKENIRMKMEDLHVKRYNNLYGLHERFVHLNVQVPLEVGEHYEFKSILQFNKYYKWRMAYHFGKFAPLTHKLENSYCYFGNWILHAEEGSLFVDYEQDIQKVIREREKLLCEELISLEREDMVKLRKQVFRQKAKNKKRGKKIWLISDRAEVAGDNGEAFFKYVSAHAPANVEPYFVIDEKCPDYERMKQYGKVIPLHSEQNRIFSLAAHRIIGSNGAEYTFNPFAADRIYLCDLMKSKYIFLQHGITKDDISDWLCKNNKNIKLFITAAKMEYDSILEGRYGYQEKEIGLTGFARYDSLIEKAEQVTSKKQLLILPTWRKIIQKLPIAEEENLSLTSDTSNYRIGFKNTDFYQFYNKLINDPRLLESMRKHGYTGLFALHPMMSAQWKDFQGNDLIRVNQGEIQYSQSFAESAILLTDYSSVFFDFGYLRRPVVYCHYDEDTFFESHTYQKGYFSYEEDGFGPVCRSYEETVSALIRIMENGGQLDEEYRSRIDSFFAFDDDKNCERILKAIMKI